MSGLDPVFGDSLQEQLEELRKRVAVLEKSSTTHHHHFPERLTKLLAEARDPEGELVTAGPCEAATRTESSE